MKKNPADYDKLTKEFFEITREKGINQNFASYVWNVLISMSKGYGFNQSHTLAYSLIALQEMNLAYKYPIIFWNCACLINDSGGNDDEEELEELEENLEEENEEEEDIEEDSEKKKKTKNTNYGKIATAIGSMIHAGISVSPPNINKSSYTFIPDVEKNTIIYGIKGINKIGDNLVKEIVSNRPYSSLNDFIHKVKINKPQMISLIKSGAFDEFGDSREQVMFKYIDSITEKKGRLTLQNMNMLIEKAMIPEELSQEVKTYNFNKYLKKHKINDDYLLDEIAYPYYAANFDLDNLWYENDKYYINQKVWDKIYTKAMDPVRDYINKNKKILLNTLNDKLFKDLTDKYCTGSISKWEMDSISFYYGPHELSEIDMIENNLDYYSSLPNTPEIDYTFSKDGKDIPIYKLHRIAGTVLDKNKNKNTVTLLTTDGVVNVKIYQAQFAKYNKQISMKLPDGKKKVLEKSWFSRGNKLIFTGIKRDDMFIPKKYKSTKYNVIELITNIYEDGTVETINERMEE